MPLERPRFSTTKLREGYDMGEVDDAIDRVFGALAEPVPSMSGADVRTLRFTPVRLREGYDMGEVDEWLDQAAAELERTAGGTAATAPATPTPATPGPAAPAAYDGTRSTAITEVRTGVPGPLLVLIVIVVVVAAVVYAVL